MSFTPTSGQVVLKEVFDEGSVPTEEEIKDYALRIGIDVENESHLLYLARDGLMQALPSGWKPCYDKDKEEIYYFNFKTKKAQWEHPLDDTYRNLVKKARNESAFSEVIDDDSRTSIKEDLKSYEEASLISTVNEMNGKPRRLEPMNPLGKKLIKRVPAILSPIKKSNSKDSLKASILKPSLTVDQEAELQKLSNNNSLKREVSNNAEVHKRPNSSDIRNRRNIDPLEFRDLIQQEIINPQTLEKLDFLTSGKKLMDGKACIENLNKVKIENSILTKDEGYGTEFSVSSMGEKEGNGKKELTLAGGGSVFLKTNKTKFSPSSDLITSSFSKEELSEGFLSPDLRKYRNEPDVQLKSILRDQSNQNSVEKVNFDSEERKAQKENIEEDKKSVRFNLEKDLKISFKLPSTTEQKPDSSFSENNTDYESHNLVFKENKNQETKQIEIDFDELKFCLNEDEAEKTGKEEKIEPVKITEPKKFRPSQILVDEFREIFSKQPKNNINLMEANKPLSSKNIALKSSRSSESIILSEISHSNENSQSNQSNKLYTKEKEDKSLIRESSTADLGEANSGKDDGKIKKAMSKTPNLSFDELVDFAIKKNLKIDSSKENDLSVSKISYPEKELFLGEILQENDDLSIDGESDSDKIFLSQQKELEYLETLESQINLKAQKRRNLEEDLKNVEKRKNETVNELERNFRIWLNETEESYEKKKREKADDLKKHYENWIKEKEQEFEKVYKKKYEEESESREKQLKSELMEKENSELEKLKLQLDAEQRDRLNKLKSELEAEGAKELDVIRKTFESELNEKKNRLIKQHEEEISEIEKKKENFLSQQRLQKLEELKLARENETLIEAMRVEIKETYQRQRNALMKEHESILENLKQDHALIVEQMKLEYKNKEEALKKVLSSKLEGIKSNTSQGNAEDEKPRTNDQEVKVFEKVRFENRLLEEKYKMLKEKYIKLKTEAKLTPKREKYKKDSYIATGSETETFNSNQPSGDISDYESSKIRETAECTKRKQDKEKKLRKQTKFLESSNQELSTEDEENLMSSKNLNYFKNASEISYLTKEKQEEIEGDLKVLQTLDKPKEDTSKKEKKLEGRETKKKKQLFSGFKTVRSSKVNSNQEKAKNQEKEVLSPVENLRRQLKKLEELEDQFPISTYTDTYMRYPFTDSAQFGSSEVEFFKHRIHLERESVRRAKDSLKAQKKIFENRQRQLKQKLIEGEPGTKAIVDQIYQESKELTDMEVAVYRTRALLGEKIIRLRHLEQSLKRISQPVKKGRDFLERLGVRNQIKDDERTLSDLSTNSGSSGFSSNDFNDANNFVNVGPVVKKSGVEQNRRNFQCNIQESSEIIQSLENLNSEIREIWEVLKNQQHSEKTIPTLPPFIFGDIEWSNFTLSPPLPFRNTIITSSNFQRPVAQRFKTQVTSTSNPRNTPAIIDSTLIDKTRCLRDWLKAAKSQLPSEVIRSSQVTL